MHRGFVAELKKILGHAQVPQLFLKGGYIGGLEEIMKLHEEGKLVGMLDGVQRMSEKDWACENCKGINFLVCPSCNGSSRLCDEDGEWDECIGCNESGLIHCEPCFKRRNGF
jgi:glutaredoxin domain-containing cysteine-rich protein 1